MSTKQGLLLSIRSVIAQGKPSMDDLGGCMYRGENGCKCSIGFLIPDKKYNREFMEGESVHGSSVLSRIPTTYKTDILWLDYLDVLQSCHDKCSLEDPFIENFKMAITNTVQEGNLPKYCLEALEEEC